MSSKAFSCEFSVSDYEFIRDHAPEDQPVVPFVCIADLLCKNILNNFTNQKSNEFIIKNLYIIKGLFLSDLLNKTFEWIYDQKNPNNYDVKLVDSIGTIYYKAEVAFDSDEIIKQYLVPNERENVSSESPMDFDIFDNSTVFLDTKPDYGNLFHGPKLHSIEIYKASNDCKFIHAKVKSSELMNWDCTSWSIDPAIADAALQLGCLIAHVKMKRPSLPVKIESIYVHQVAKAVASQIYCSIKINTINKLKYTFDAYFFLDNNDPLCVFRGVNAYFRFS